MSSVNITCWSCKTLYTVPSELYKAARASDRIGMYCPYGHAGYYNAKAAEEENEREALRRERDVLKQRLAEKDDTIAAERKLRLKAEKSSLAIRKRAKGGVCPCCTRSFSELRRHMATKHPEFKAEEVAA